MNPKDPSKEYSRTLGKILFFAALLVTSACMFVPFAPQMPGSGLDPSWIFGMNQALAQGLSFGRDVVFTFGPYSSVYTRHFHPATDGLMMAGGAYIALCFFIASALNFQNAKWPLQVGLLAVLTATTVSKDALFFFYPLLAGIYLFRVITANHEPRKTPIRKSLLVAFLFSPFGLLPLIKGSMLGACGIVLILASILLLKHKRIAYITAIWLAPIIASLFFWTLADQPVQLLPAYLSSMISLIRGYTEAMSMEGRFGQVALYLLAAVVLLGTIFFNRSAPLHARTLLMLFFCSILFLSFKAAFVRHGGHALSASTMLLLATLLYGTLQSGKRLAPVFMLSIATWFLIDAAYVKTSTQNLLDNIANTYKAPWVGLLERIDDPGSLTARYTERLREIADNAKLPALSGTVDVYSYDQSTLIASGNTWHPRPIFQSYAAYLPELAEKNLAHLRSNRRPDQILFAVQPIDGRLPALEDGMSWRTLLDLYRPTALLPNHLLMERRADRFQPGGDIRTISKKTHALGEKIEIPRSKHLVFSKVRLKQSLLGKLTGIVYKPSELSLIVRTGDTSKTFRFIASMGRGEFLMDPLIEQTREFAFLYQNREYLEEKRVDSITLEIPNHRWQWKPTFELELFTVNLQKNEIVPDFYGLAKPMLRVEGSTTSEVSQCEGVVDFINGHPPSAQLLQAGALLKINGWLAASIARGIPAHDIYFVLTASTGKKAYLKATQMIRPDVAAHFKKPTLASSGYSLLADASGLKGMYVVEMAHIGQNILTICSNYQFNVQFNGTEAR